MIAVIILLILSAVFLAILLYAYRTAFYTSKKHREETMPLPAGEQYTESAEKTNALMKELALLPFEEVSVTSFDGLKLSGRYYHIKDGAPLHIQFHGYRGSALRDFCGGSKLAREMGHNTLLVDQRSQGKSEGCTISFGINERMDAKSWVEYAVSRFGRDTEIFLSGISMGASTVLMASAFSLPNVKGILADCPYSSPRKIIRKVIRDMRLPASVVYPFVKLAARILGRFSLESADCIESVKNASVPILLIHGEDDRFVPKEMSEEIHSANPDKISLHLFPGAGHGLSYMKDTKRYEAVSREFILWCLHTNQSEKENEHAISYRPE